MGKGKLHDKPMYRCDYTGVPMPTAGFQLGQTKPGSTKVSKTGNFLNAEAAVAYLYLLDIDADTRKCMHDWVNGQVGAVVSPAPHLSRLQWLQTYVAPPPDAAENYTITNAEYFDQMCISTFAPFTAVHLSHTGRATEIAGDYRTADSYFTEHLLPAPGGTNPDGTREIFGWPQRMIANLSKAGAKKTKWPVHVFYRPFNNALPPNKTASSLFKMQLWGDVVCVYATKNEASHYPRQRYTSFTLADFDQIKSAAAPKRKRVEPQALTVEEYNQTVKQGMRDDLRAVEHVSTSLAENPNVLARAQVMPPPLGKELASIADPSGEIRAGLKAQALAARTVEPTAA